MKLYKEITGLTDKERFEIYEYLKGYFKGLKKDL